MLPVGLKVFFSTEALLAEDLLRGQQPPLRAVLCCEDGFTDRPEASRGDGCIPPAGGRERVWEHPEPTSDFRESQRSSAQPPPAAQFTSKTHSNESLRNRARVSAWIGVATPQVRIPCLGTAFGSTLPAPLPSSTELYRPPNEKPEHTPHLRHRIQRALLWP